MVTFSKRLECHMFMGVKIFQANQINLAKILWVSPPLTIAVRKVKVLSHSVLSDSLRPHGVLCPWDSPGKNTGVDSHSLLQRIFPTQGLNPCLLHCRRILHCLSHQRSPTVTVTITQFFMPSM